MKKTLMIIFGFISLGLGIIGIVLPILPTTPFLLLSAGLFLKSSKKLYKWLTKHPVFGKYIMSYMEYKAVDKRSKIIAITILWISIGISIFLISSMWIKALLFIIAVAVTIHISLLKTLTEDMVKQFEIIQEK